jgi:hypothetical protein
VVRVIIDDDIVAVPKPVVAILEVKRSDTEVEAAKPETAGIATLDAPSVSPAHAAVEVTVLPGVVDVEAGVVATIVVPYPFAVVVHVRSFGVIVTVAIRAPFPVVVLVAFVSVAMISGGTMARNVTTADVVLAIATAMLIVLRMCGK